MGGVAVARLLKHRPNAAWFKIHRVLQPTGLCIATAGWVLALYRFDVFSGDGTRTIHGILGIVVMTIGLMQPMNAFIRPHAPHDGQKKTTWRQNWEYWHKGAGY